MLQAYFIFAIGNLRPIFDQLYGECFKTYTACSRALVASQTYAQARVPACDCTRRAQGGCRALLRPGLLRRRLLRSMSHVCSLLLQMCVRMQFEPSIPLRVGTHSCAQFGTLHSTTKTFLSNRHTSTHKTMSVIPCMSAHPDVMHAQNRWQAKCQAPAGLWSMCPISVLACMATSMISSAQAPRWRASCWAC